MQTNSCFFGSVLVLVTFLLCWVLQTLFCFFYSILVLVAYLLCWVLLLSVRAMSHFAPGRASKESQKVSFHSNLQFHHPHRNMVFRAPINVRSYCSRLLLLLQGHVGVRR